MANRKALLVGINRYKDSPLNCCINDVDELNSIINRDLDGKILYSTETLKDFAATKENILEKVIDLFGGTGDTALFYFSGHGMDNENDGVLVTVDYDVNDYGIAMKEILEIANKSKYTNKIIILDCCHSGFMGNFGIIGDKSYLNDGVVILTASRKEQFSIEVNGHGMFTNLLIQALRGSAADILGRITPGSIYNFIDQSLGEWGQRPLFKANVSKFINVVEVEPKIELKILMKIAEYFKFDNKFHLNPSFEKTNYKNSSHKNLPPYCNELNVKIFTDLQLFNRFGLVKPADGIDMYFAAMESKYCELTELGKHYVELIKGSII